MSRDRIVSLGPNYAEWPAEFWGSKDWEHAQATNQPMGQTLPTPPPDRPLPAGFSLFPGIAHDSAGQRALREIRSAQATRALRKLGLY